MTAKPASTLKPATAELHGLVAVVTGASSGIGQATARLLAQRGAAVIAHGRSNVGGLQETVSSLTPAHQAHDFTTVDLASDEGPQQLVAWAWEATARIDIWVNFAGADVLTGPARELSFEDKLQLLWQTDVMGTIRTSRLVAERMLAQPPGPATPVILNMGWDQAEHGMPGDAGEMFGPIKAAVMSFTRSFARTVSPRLRVNAVAPGWIQTAWGQDAPAYWQARAQQESLRGRWGNPADVAAAAAYLVSPQADFINGQILAVNGGFRHGFDPLPESRQNS